MKFKLLFIFTLFFSSSPLCAMDHPIKLDEELAEAVKSGNIEQVESWLKDINTRIPAFSLGTLRMLTPLMFAAENGYIKSVRLLLKYDADITPRDSYGRTALIMAVDAGQTKTVKLLLDYHQTHINAIDAHLRTALHHAARFQSTIVNILLKNGADINLKDVDGETALYSANTVGVIELLLKYINHILDQTHDPKVYHQWDVYILHTLKDVERFHCHNKLDKINEFRMLLHHASKLPLSTKKLESLIAKALKHRYDGEYAFRKTVKHLRKSAF